MRSPDGKGRTIAAREGVAELRRVLGLRGALALGMGSIVGTGVFVSVGVAAEIAGPSVLIAIVLAGVVALCNGLSSAQLASLHPASGGTYEYGYRWLSPQLGFLAGWMFLCAKSASAATAALGFAGYLLRLLDVRDDLRVSVALAVLCIVTLLTLGGLRRSNRVNGLIVSVTLVSLACFVMVGLWLVLPRLATQGWPTEGVPFEFGRSLSHATALLFVAFTGYGRIATLGEEVCEPQRTIPQAILATIGVAMVIYLGVAFVGIATVGSEAFGAAAHRDVAALAIVAKTFQVPGVVMLVTLGALTAMVGVLLNLVLGLSRVVLAMGRRGDMPRWAAHIDSQTNEPRAATLIVAGLIGLLCLCRDVRVTWSFSAFTVLIYYAITNLCLLRVPRAERRWSVASAYVGLASCLYLAFWVEPSIWLTGILLMAIGWLWQRWLRGPLRA